MPRRREGQSNRVELLPDTSDSGVKTKAVNELVTIQNETNRGAANCEKLPCEIKAVLPVLRSNEIKNGEFSNQHPETYLSKSLDCQLGEKQDNGNTAPVTARNTHNCSVANILSENTFEQAKNMQDKACFGSAVLTDSVAETSDEGSQQLDSSCSVDRCLKGERSASVVDRDCCGSFQSRVSVNSNEVELDSENHRTEPCSQTSGLLPAVSSCTKSSSEAQLNYRLATTIVETKPGASCSSASAKISSSSSVLVNQQHCGLPSSVYGTAASSVEKVLTGFNVSSTRQTGLETFSSEAEDSAKEVEQASPGRSLVIQNTFCEGTSTVNNIQKCQNEYSCSSDHKNGWVASVSEGSVKSRFSDAPSSDESDSLSNIPEGQRNSTVPKITSPQFLEQHISKIISENAAIVQTLDPVWSKRYMRQSSLSSCGTETTVIQKSGSSRLRTLSEEKVIPDAGHSKLQSALLGSLNAGQNQYARHDMPKLIEPPAILVSPVPLAKPANVALEEELKGNAIKSLLSLKEGKYVSHVSRERYDPHPQNPEGSIIKDLLLKTKEKYSVLPDNDHSVVNKAISTSVITENFMNTASTVVQCSICGLKFSDFKALETHRLSCKGSKPVTSLEKKTVAPTNGMLLSKLGVSEGTLTPSNMCLPILNPSVLSSSIEGLLKSDSLPPNDMPVEGAGRILKSQLLAPISQRKSPPLKRRKISEPVYLTGYTPSELQKKQSAVPEPVDGVGITAHRSRSQSVHLFGGEVQVHEGAKLKKFRILSSLATSTAQALEPGKDDQPRRGTPLAMVNSKAEAGSLPAVVVTIAQPVHNSGGTVTHVTHGNTAPFSQVIPVTSSSSVVLKNNMKSDVVSVQADNFLSAYKRSIIDRTSPTVIQTSSIIQRAGKSIKVSSTNVPEVVVGHALGTSKSNSMPAIHVAHLASDKSPALQNLSINPGHVNGNTEGLKSLHITAGVVASQAAHPIESQQESLQVLQKQIVPTVLFTPSSPTNPTSEAEEVSTSESSKKFLAPARPTSLPLKKKPFTMVGSTLISPETPRPKKSVIQLYINGHAYTYLGLKCSTRSTYCCIYRPQPMFVLQETDQKLSMYSNWQVVPSKEELGGLTPGQMIAFYNSKQLTSNSKGIYTSAKPSEPLLFTHSSYWTFRFQERDKNDLRLQDSQTREIAFAGEHCHDGTQLMDEHQTVVQKDSTTQDSLICTESISSVSTDGQTSAIPENSSSIDIDVPVSDGDGNITHEDDDENDDKQEVNADSSQLQTPKRVKIFEGGFKSNEDYTYVRGRGRGKYVCEECGIRCKKPSMLKKHIRTHTDLRPYKCRHCSFAFKTKGNLTKHMKSKAHHKKCTELGIVPVPTTSDDSQIDEEALAKQEQFKKQNFRVSDGEDNEEDDDDDDGDDDVDSDGIDEEYESDNSTMTTTAKSISVANGGHLWEKENARHEVMDEASSATDLQMQHSVEQEAARSLLHLSSLNEVAEQWSSAAAGDATSLTNLETLPIAVATSAETFAPVSPQASSRPSPTPSASVAVKRTIDQTLLLIPEEPLGHRPRSYSADVPFRSAREHLQLRQSHHLLTRGGSKTSEDSVLGSADLSIKESSTRRYSISVAREAQRSRTIQSPFWGSSVAGVQKPNEAPEQPMDLRISRPGDVVQGGQFLPELVRVPSIPITSAAEQNTSNSELYVDESFAVKPVASATMPEFDSSVDGKGFSVVVTMKQPPQQQQALQSGSQLVVQPRTYYQTETTAEGTTAPRSSEGDLVHSQLSPDGAELSVSSPVSPSSLDDSYFQHEKVGGNVSASPNGLQYSSGSHMEFVKPGTSNMEEGKCVCKICNKVFTKAGQLRIHVNIHYFERPFRCENCGVSFRTKGHLQKHKRSVSHYNKVNMNMTFGTPSVDNPRPFKCADCKIAFRIHGHLAKHLRSKMHIMKLECLGKLPFGMYAEMERSGVSLNEIDTTDCNNSLESLQAMAQKLYHRDPRRMRWHSPNAQAELEVSKNPAPVPVTPGADPVPPVPEQLSITLSSPSAIGVPVPSIMNLNPAAEEDVKHEPSDTVAFHPSASALVEGEIPTSVTLSVSSQFPGDQGIPAPAASQIQRPDATDTGNVSLHRSDTCHLCGRMFKSAKFLQVHLYCDHSSWNLSSGEATSDDSSTTQSPHVTVIAQDLVCDLCGKHFANQNSLQQHLLTHAQPRPFVCEVCDAGFTSSMSLMAHLATHQPVQPRGVPNTGSSTTGVMPMQ